MSGMKSSTVVDTERLAVMITLVTAAGALGLLPASKGGRLLVAGAVTGAGYLDRAGRPTNQPSPAIL